MNKPIYKRAHKDKEQATDVNASNTIPTKLVRIGKSFFAGH